jgi:MFS family permease
MLSGLAYGALSGRVATKAVLFIGAFAYPAAFAVLALATSLETMCILIIPVGLATGLWATARNHLVTVTSPTELRTSANGWVLLSAYLGLSAGLAIGGAVVAAAGWRAALVIGSLVVAGAPVVTLLGRRALLDPTIRPLNAEPAACQELPASLLTDESRLRP